MIILNEFDKKDEHEHIQTEIVSIIDANSGENIDFKVDDDESEDH
jgi:hypothetical protein